MVDPLTAADMGSLVRRLDGRAQFFDQSPQEASRSNLQKSADLFREAARELESLRKASRDLMLYADECALILHDAGYPAKAQSLNSRVAAVDEALGGPRRD